MSEFHVLRARSTCREPPLIQLYALSSSSSTFAMAIAVFLHPQLAHITFHSGATHQFRSSPSCPAGQDGVRTRSYRGASEPKDEPHRLRSMQRSRPGETDVGTSGIAVTFGRRKRTTRADGMLVIVNRYS